MTSLKSWPKTVKLLLSIGIAISLVSLSMINTSTEVLSQESKDNHATQELSPEVLSFIGNNYFSHISQFPDPNETVEVLQAYLDGDQALREERLDDALRIFEKAVKEFPHSRHAHEGYGRALMEKYRTTQDLPLLMAAADEYYTATEIGLKYGKVKYTDQLVAILEETKDAERFKTLFAEIFTSFPHDYLATHDYAKGLALLDDPNAEEMFKKAIKLRPEGSGQVIADFGEYLIVQERYEDALANMELQPEDRLSYIHLLRGFALEKLGRLEEAKKEYSACISSGKYRYDSKKYQTELAVQTGILFK